MPSTPSVRPSHHEPEYKLRIYCRHYYRWHLIFRKRADIYRDIDQQKFWQHIRTSEAYKRLAKSTAHKLVPYPDNCNDGYLSDFCDDLVYRKSLHVYPRPQFYESSDESSEEE